MMRTRSTNTILDKILASVEEDLERRKAARSEAVLLREYSACAGATRRGFRRALEEPGVRVIAEVKRASPSKGSFAAAREPADQALEYARAGAACISVVTEPAFFGGSLGMLKDIRAAVDLPLLRKDFIIDTYQLCEAAVAGADAVLLIAAALEDEPLRELSAAATELGLEVLFEASSRQEVERVVQAGARIVGVNNRDLRDFSTDSDRSLKLAPAIPSGVLRVSESGIECAAQIRRLREAGYQGFLIGEFLMRQPDPASALRELIRGSEPGGGGACV